MKIFCITLKETPFRTEGASAHFQSVGLDVEFYRGWYGPSLGLKTTIPFNQTKHPLDSTNKGIEPYFLNSSQIGLILSHLTIWEICLHLPDEEFLIIEDDCHFPDDFKEKFSAYRSQLPDDWEYVFVGHCCTDGHKTVKAVSENVARKEIALCNHCALIRKSVMPRLIAMNRVFWAPLDIQMAHLCLPFINHYCFLPALVSQKSADGKWTSSLLDSPMKNLSQSEPTYALK